MRLPDVETLRLCSFLASTAFGLVFVTLWSRERTAAHFALWGLSSLLYAVAILAFSIAARSNEVVLSALFCVLGITNVLPIAGARVLEGLPPFRRWMIVPLVAATGGHAAPALLAKAGWVLPGGVAQTVGDAAGLSISMGLGGIALAFVPAAMHSTGRRMAGFAMLGYLPAYALSVIFSVLALPGGEMVALLAMLSDQVLLGVLNLGLLAIPVERVQRGLLDAAMRDPLTSVWNRAGLDRAAGAYAMPGCAVIALDVDAFKSVNDRFGHAAGDEVLIAIAREARALAGNAGGQVARMGGDEFVVLLPAGEDASRFAASLRERLAGARALDAEWDVSMGFALVEPDEPTVTAAVRRADTSLYLAKAQAHGRAPG